MSAGLAPQAHVLVECMGDEAALERCAATIGVRRARLRRGLGSGSARSPGERAASCCGLGVPATALAETIEAAARRGATAWGHLAAGSVLVAAPELAADDVRALRAHAVEHGGFLQIEAGPASLRAEVDPFGEGERELVRALRHQFDGRHTINRGRWEAEP